jgi:hypothetical protein
MYYNGRQPSIKDRIGSNLGAKTTSNLMPIEIRFPTFLRARLQWCKIKKVTYYIMITLLSIGLEKFMLRNLIMLLIMPIFTEMRLLVLGIQHMLIC